MMPPREYGDWQLECAVIRERGARLLATEQWADCSFLLGRERAPVKAHRLILAMASPVFDAMFYGPLAEGDAPIPIPDIQPDAFKKLLQYVYTDDVNLESYKIAFEVYYAADKYLLPHLQTLCTTYLSGNLVPQNACGIYEFANFIKDEKLEKASLKVIKDKTKLALAPGSSFEYLALGTVIRIFSRSRLTIESELDLLAAAERYVLAWQKCVKEMTSNVVPEDVSVSNSIIKDTSKVDTVKCDLNSDGDKKRNTSSSDADQEYVFVSKSLRIDKDTIGNNEVDTVKCNPDSNGDIGNQNEQMSIPNEENEEPMAEADTQSACSEVINKARSEGTFSFTVNNVSKMEKRVVSPSFYVRNLPWRIEVLPVEKGQTKYLCFFVRCNGDSKSITWSCKALIDYTLISHKSDTKLSYTLGTYNFFCSSSAFVGYPNFMTWNDVLDPENGYVKDDAITLEVRVIVEPPQGLSWCSKNCISGIDIKYESVTHVRQALLWPIRFLTLTVKELAEYEPKLSLLTNDDVLAIMMNIASENTKTPMPPFLTRERTSRFKGLFRRPAPTTHTPCTRGHHA